MVSWYPPTCPCHVLETAKKHHFMSWLLLFTQHKHCCILQSYLFHFHTLFPWILFGWKDFSSLSHDSQPLNLATLLFQLSSSGMCDSVFCLLPLLAHTVKNFHILCSVEFLASPLFLFFSGAIITCQDCGQPCPGAQRVTMKMERVLHVITSKYILLSLKQCKYIYKECL